MIETLRRELRAIEATMYYMEETDTAFYPAYTKLWKQSKILKKAIRKLEKLEVHK